jgi:integrase
MAYIRTVGHRHKVEIRVTMPGGLVHKENEYFDSLVTAREWAKEREAELRVSATGGFPRKTVSDLIQRWRDEVAPGRDGSKWDINRCNQVLALFKELGFDGLLLSEFGPSHMAKVRERRLTEVGPPSVKREETLVKSIWAAARHPSWHWTDKDPFLNLGPIKGSKGRPRKRKAQWTELKRILRELQYHPRKPEGSKSAEVGLAMMLALRTTLRSQEVLQLGDDCVDLDRLVITIPKHKTRYVTNDSKRIPMMPKALLLMARKCFGKSRYFTVATSSRDTLYRRAKRLVGVPDLTFHDLKRTSVLLLKGLLTEDELMAVTGNTDVEVLRRHYMTDTAAEAAKTVWKALGAEKAKVLAQIRA